jgi:hypothetical protein
VCGEEEQDLEELREIESQSLNASDPLHEDGAKEEEYELVLEKAGEGEETLIWRSMPWGQVGRFMGLGLYIYTSPAQIQKGILRSTVHYVSIATALINSFILSVMSFLPLSALHLTLLLPSTARYTSASSARRGWPLTSEFPLSASHQSVPDLIPPFSAYY